MAWRVAGAALTWHQNLKSSYPSAAPPATPSVAWGTIGDTSHSSTSDHSPKDFPGWGNDIVTAADAPHAPGLGLDMHRVTEAMRLSRDQRIKYVIFNRRIFSSYSTSTRTAWSWGAYSNAVNDPHTDHAHLSVVGDPRGDDTRPWQIGASPMAVETDVTFMAWRLEALTFLKPKVAGGPEVGAEVPLVAALADLRTRLAALEAKQVQLSAADRAAIVADLKAAVVGELADLLPSAADINAALDAAIESRLNGATIHTTGH